MTRAEAAEKIAKLRRLAQGSSNPHEAKSAQEQADRLAAEHHLTEGDLQAGRYAAAHDELVDSIQKFAAEKMQLRGLGASIFGVGPIVADVVAQMKKIDDGNKETRLRRIVTVARTAAMIGGQNDLVAGLMAVIEATLKNHDLHL